MTRSKELVEIIGKRFLISDGVLLNFIRVERPAEDISRICWKPGGRFKGEPPGSIQI